MPDWKLGVGETFSRSERWFYGEGAELTLVGKSGPVGLEGGAAVRHLRTASVFIAERNSTFSAHDGQLTFLSGYFGITFLPDSAFQLGPVMRFGYAYASIEGEKFDWRADKTSVVSVTNRQHGVNADLSLRTSIKPGTSLSIFVEGGGGVLLLKSTVTSLLLQGGMAVHF